MILQLSVDSHSVISGIDSTFTFLRQRDIDFYILTNDAARAPLELASAYLEAGLAEVTEEKIISSGMLACEYLRNKIRSGPVAFVGTDASAHYVETAGLTAISIQDLELDDAAEIQALVFLDDEGCHWEKTLNHSVNLLRARNIPVIVANTDATLETDIMGGNHFGIDTALVLTGNTPQRDARLMMEATGILPDYVFASVLE